MKPIDGHYKLLSVYQVLSTTPLKNDIFETRLD